MREGSIGDREEDRTIERRDRSEREGDRTG